MFGYKGPDLRKINIAEIENSYLNFFTPAVIVAIGYFLFNLIAWPLAFIQWLTGEIDSTTFGLIVMILILFLISGIVLFLFIPRLKVLDVDYKEVSGIGLVTVFLLVCVAASFQTLLKELYRFLDIKLKNEEPWFISSYKDLKDPILLLLFLFYSCCAYPIFTELFYRRMIIPLLEDRGLSPFHAVILSSLGFAFIELPSIFIDPNYTYYTYTLLLVLILGFCAGLIYILTRNVLFPVLFGTLYYFYDNIGFLGKILEKNSLHMMYDLLTGISFLISLGVMIYIILKLIETEITVNWVKEIKKTSVPNIHRGVIGFFILSLGLLGIQILVVKIGRNITNTEEHYPANVFPDYFTFITIFYLIAFSVPYWLTISTEYAQD